MPDLLDLVYDAQDEQQRLAALLEPRYRRALAAVHELVHSAFPGELGAAPDEAAVEAVLAAAAERVLLIDAATQRGIIDALAAGAAGAAGAAALDHLYAQTWRHRAEVVAGSELTQAQTVAALDRYAAAGVSRVRIVEDPNTDPPCAVRNGRVVPLAERPMPLHPNCRMRIVPVVERGEAA